LNFKEVGLEFDPLQFEVYLGSIEMNIKILCLGITSTLVAIAGLGLCLPNVMWLKHSTIRINNQGNTTVDLTKLQVGEETQEIRAIEPGTFHFGMLPQQSQGSLAVTLPPNQKLDSFCHTFVEEKMYHVDISLKEGKVLSCETSLPILSNLWVLKAML
jgi:hypothetical protein